MINETLKSIKENRYSYSSPTIEEGAQKLLDLKEENARLKELNREMVEALKELVYLNNSISKGKTYAPIDKDERVEIWNRVAELLAKTEEGEGE